MGRLSAVMRVYVVLFGIAISGVLETGSVASAATGTGAGGLTATAGGFARASHMITHGLPTLVVGSYRGQRPRNIYFSGDAGNIVDNLRWSTWTSSHAAASGWSLIQGCVPDCATGAEIQVPNVDHAARPSRRLFHPDHRATRWSEREMGLHPKPVARQLASGTALTESKRTCGLTRGLLGGHRHGRLRSCLDALGPLG